MAWLCFFRHKWVPALQPGMRQCTRCSAEKRRLPPGAFWCPYDCGDFLIPPMVHPYEDWDSSAHSAPRMARGLCGTCEKPVGFTRGLRDVRKGRWRSPIAAPYPPRSE